MQMGVSERLRAFIKSEGISVNKFEKSCGFGNGYVGNISKGIGADKLQIILENYPRLNSKWLITGEGEMLQPSQGTAVSDNNSVAVVGNGNKVEHSEGGCVSELRNQYEARLAEKDKQIEWLTGLVDRLTAKE